MTVVTKSGESSKWETLRKLRFGDVRKLIIHRYGPAGCPDDDAGRPDLMELLYLASLAPAGAEKKVANLIELYAPWMQPDEVEALIQHLSLNPKLSKAAHRGGAWSHSPPDQRRP
jgi:hypothetical protein